MLDRAVLSDSPVVEPYFTVSLPAPTPSPEVHNFNTDAERTAEVLRRVDAVSIAEDLTPADKQQMLTPLIRAIYSEAEGFSLELRPSVSFAQGESVIQMISTHCPPGPSR